MLYFIGKCGGEGTITDRQKKDPAQMPLKEYLWETYPDEMAQLLQQQAAADAARALDAATRQAIAGYRALNDDAAQLTGLAAETVKATNTPAGDIIGRNLEKDAERAMKYREKSTQDAPEYTAGQAAQLIAAAAAIIGKPAEELTIEDAEAVLFQEIGVTVPKTPMQAARAILIKNIEAERETAQEAAQEAQEGKEDAPRRIVVDMGDYDPRLDPNAPEFDIAAYRKAIADAGGMEAMTERLKESFTAVQKQMQETMLGAIKGTAPTMAAAMQDTITQNAEALRDTAAAIALTAQYALKGIAEFINSDTYNTIKGSIAAISAFVAQHSAEIEALADAAQEIQDLAPFLEMELEETRKDPAFSEYTLDDLLEQGFDADGNPIDSPFRQIIERAKQRQAEFTAAEDTIATVEQAAEELPRIIANSTDLLQYPLDKPNSKIWALLQSATPDGQLNLDIVTSKKGSKQDAIVYYSISFDELETGVKITKQLTPFDKRVYIAAAALFNGGNSTMSTTQIYKMMGNRGQPKTGDVQKINDSLAKMGAARVYLDNTQEVQVNKKYKHFKYDASLLPFERISAYINGQLVESAIHLFREPPLISFARERGQITGLTRQLLESPISKTDANLQLEDYLLERIGHMKSPKSRTPRKMLYSTIYDRCGITTKKQKQRAPEKIRRYLEHYKQCGWIKGYTETADGITIEI